MPGAAVRGATASGTSPSEGSSGAAEEVQAPGGAASGRVPPATSVTWADASVSTCVWLLAGIEYAAPTRNSRSGPAGAPPAGPAPEARSRTSGCGAPSGGRSPSANSYGTPSASITVAVTWSAWSNCPAGSSGEPPAVTFSVAVKVTFRVSPGSSKPPGPGSCAGRSGARTSAIGLPPVRSERNCMAWPARRVSMASAVACRFSVSSRSWRAAGAAAAMPGTAA